MIIGLSGLSCANKKIIGVATVSLRDMKFYAFHGYYDFERRIGNNFIVDLDLEVDIPADPNDHIENTYNYELAYQIVDSYMKQKYKLLEGLAYDIAKEIKQSDEKVDKVKITLSKNNPPLGGKVGQARVTIEI